jgi:hypothetical protein
MRAMAERAGFFLTLSLACLVSGCALRAVDVPAAPVSPADFGGWSCARIGEELERVRRNAAEVAYAFDERAGANIVAMGVGAVVFWPALLAMRSNGQDRELLAQLKGRHEALVSAQSQRPCPASADTPAATGALPLAVGDTLVYEQRAVALDGGPAAERPRELSLRVLDIGPSSLSLAETAQAAPREGVAAAAWQMDRLGNLLQGPVGPLWPQLVRTDLGLGQVVSGELIDPQDTATRARVRGQVVALGPQSVSGRAFDAAVIELFGDVQDGQGSSRLEGVLVIDRHSGILLRLDLYGSHPAFRLQRRLVRVLAPAP